MPPPTPSVALPEKPVVLALADPMLPQFAPDAQGIVWDTPGPIPVEEPPTITPSRRLPLWPLVGLLGVEGHGELPPPIPEPGTVVLLATGLGALVGRIARRRRGNITR